MSEIVSLCSKLFEARNGEIWRVSTLTRTGRVVPCSATRADRPRHDGYHSVNIGKRKVLAHRVAWILAYGGIPSYMEINHKNGIRGDNRIENLELVTKRENLIHSYKELGRFRASGTKNGRAKLCEDQVFDIRASTKSSRQIAKIYGVSKTTINRIRSGERWSEMPP